MAKLKKTINLLIVDDVAVLRDSLRFFFKISCVTHSRMNIDETGSGEIAVNMAAKKHDLIFMDYSMPPGISGAEATKQIRKLAPQTNILGYSSYNGLGTVQEMIKAGATGYLLKGSKRGETTEAIQTVLSGKHFYSKKLRKELEG